jgi:hypothetical protein
MARIQIKTQLPPERCEVCHQSDLFYPQRNYCTRCSEIAINSNGNYSVVRKHSRKEEIRASIVMGVLLLSLSVGLGTAVIFFGFKDRQSTILSIGFLICMTPQLFISLVALLSPLFYDTYNSPEKPDENSPI